MAKKLGLYFHGHTSHPNSIGEINGMLNGRKVSIFTSTEEFNINKINSSIRTTCVYTWLDPSLALGLHLSRQGVFNILSKTIGAQDLETGDIAFDIRFLIKTQKTEKHNNS